ncbi:MAG: flagellar assembly protein FliW [Verrucomicrobia bacterium]|nr:flagellar assembly protein FliW [Verrucomicrobiota bacterium]
MKFAELTEPELLETEQDNVIHLPLGLLGFEKIKKYVLLADPEEAPFLWLQVMDDPNLAFLVLFPLTIIPDYHPDISAEDAEFLGLEEPADALVFNIVTLRPQGKATVNLKGPIVLNRRTLMGKQVIPVNAAEYSLQHPLPA